MYIFEFTDEYIKLYNKKNNLLIKEPIPLNIIVNNKIYDYLKLINILNKIVNKYKVINSLFRIKIKILIFEKLTPSEYYLFKNTFKFTTNIIVELINVNKYFKNNYLIISGNLVYSNNKVLKKLYSKEYILIGNSDNFDLIKKNIENKYKVNLLEYENSDTIIYEKI